MKVLIDRNIERNAITHRSALMPRTIKWGLKDWSVAVLERTPFPPRDDEAFRKEQLPFLATVGELARESRINLFSSFELSMERFRQKGNDQGYLGLNLLQDVIIQKVPSPINRSLVIGAFGHEIGTTEEEQMAFFRSVKDDRFQSIRTAVGEKHVDDAYHLWTAECSKLEAFLTMDQKFLRQVNQEKGKISSPVGVFTPKSFCESLGKVPTDIEVISKKFPPFL